MFAGHLGAGLLLKRAGPNVGLGTLFLSVMLLDAVLWLLVLFGIESIRTPPGFQRMADLQFDFPFSHGLTASLLWSVAAAGLFRLIAPRAGWAACAVVAAAVFSHFVLDWLVHVPELPVAGRSSPMLGLGLWKHLPAAWAIEILLAAAGLVSYASGARLPGRRLILLAGVMVFVTALTLAGQASTAQPPAAAAMAATSLLTIALLSAFGWWIERADSSNEAIKCIQPPAQF